MRSLACLALAAPLASAGNLHVGLPGSGAPYSTIHAAVAAAQPGDTVIVGLGDFHTSEPLVIDKPLTVLGSGGGAWYGGPTHVVQHADLLGTIDVPLRITGLGPGEEVRFVGIGFRYETHGVYAAPDRTIVVEDCDGPVVLADLVVGAPITAWGENRLSRVWIEGSSRVFLDGCSLIGRGWTAQGSPEVEALRIVDSVVSISGSVIQGGPGEAGPAAGPATDGGIAMLVEGSDVTLGSTEVEGGMGGLPPSSAPFTPGDGGDGLHVKGSTVRFLGGPGERLEGGDGGVGGPGPFGGTYHGQDGLAMVVEPDATVVTTPLAKVALGTGVVVDGTWSVLPERTAGADCDREVITTLWTSLTVDLSGEPGSTCFVVLGFDLGPALDLPGVVGTAHLDPVAHVVLTTAAIDAQGTATYDAPIPSWPALVGETFLVQAAAVSPTLVLSFSPPLFVGMQP